jgi:hypothetical protein
LGLDMRFLGEKREKINATAKAEAKNNGNKSVASPFGLRSSVTPQRAKRSSSGTPFFGRAVGPSARFLRHA